MLLTATTTFAVGVVGVFFAGVAHLTIATTTNTTIQLHVAEAGKGAGDDDVPDGVHRRRPNCSDCSRCTRRALRHPPSRSRDGRRNVDRRHTAVAQRTGQRPSIKPNSRASCDSPDTSRPNDLEVSSDKPRQPMGSCGSATRNRCAVRSSSNPSQCTVDRAVLAGAPGGDTTASSLAEPVLQDAARYGIDTGPTRDEIDAKAASHLVSTVSLTDAESRCVVAVLGPALPDSPYVELRFADAYTTANEAFATAFGQCVASRARAATLSSPDDDLLRVCISTNADESEAIAMLTAVCSWSARRRHHHLDRPSADRGYM